MKDIKISLLLLISLSLLLLAFVVLFIWGFTYYKQSIIPATATLSKTIIAKDSSAILRGVHGAPQKIYTPTIEQLNAELHNTRVDVDSLQENMNAKLAEFGALKNEIAVMLQNKNTTSSAPGITQQKIIEPQGGGQDWRKRYDDVAEENKKLSRMLSQLSRKKNEPLASGTSPVSSSKKSVERTISAAVFQVSSLQLKAIGQASNAKEQETTQAVDVEKWQGTFELNNPPASLARSEMYVVVLQPDGRLMKQSAWESGSFETKDGRKIYSCKVVFDCTKGENKRLSFSLSTEQYQKGNYTFHLYHDGKLIARASKSLS